MSLKNLQKAIDFMIVVAVFVAFETFIAILTGITTP